MEDIEKEKNNFDTLLTINKNELTSDIIKHFRYVEPIIEYVPIDKLLFAVPTQPNPTDDKLFQVGTVSVPLLVNT